MRYTLVPSLLLLALAAHAAEQAPAPGPVPAAPAAEGAPVPVPQPVAPAETPSNWKNEGRIGAFFNSTTTSNADVSLDPTIGGASRSTAMLGTLDYKALWEEGTNSMDHIVKARYGRVRTNDQAWTENEDEARYDGVLRHTVKEPNFVYLSWGLESVWTGPYQNAPALPPTNGNNNFDPLLAKVGGGFGQKYANWIPEDKFEWRLGARAQKRWGSQIQESQRGIETGIEAFMRYEGTPTNYNKDLKYFAQYEGFSEFNDLQHITNLITAGLTFQLSKYINLELALRGYYETRPKEDRDDKLLAGYNVWSIKQDTLIGVVYGF
jgi:hypothetical protein